MAKFKLFTPGKILFFGALAAAGGAGWFFYAGPAAQMPKDQVQVADYLALSDSLDNIYAKMREDSNINNQKYYQDQARFLTVRLTSTREALAQSESAPSDVEDIKGGDSTAAQSLSGDRLIDSNEFWKNPVLLSVLGVAVLLIFGIALVARKVVSGRAKMPPIPKAPPRWELMEEELSRPAYRPTMPKTDRVVDPTRAQPFSAQVFDEFKAPEPVTPVQQASEPEPIPSWEDLNVPSAAVAPEPVREEIPAAPRREEAPRVAPSPRVAVTPPEDPTPAWEDPKERLKGDVIKLARRGFTSSEIAKRMRVSQDQVELLLRVHREKGMDF